MLVGVVKFICRIGGWLTRPFRKPREAWPTIGVKAGAAALDRPATAVAGYVRRIMPEDHRLAQRLKSVARLNVPKGRKPYTPIRPTKNVQIPVARLGSKRVRPAVRAHGRLIRSVAAPSAVHFSPAAVDYTEYRIAA